MALKPHRLADGLVAASADGRTKDKKTYPGWGEIVVFAACTATRIGEVSGVRIKDIDTEHWIWKLVRQTTPEERACSGHPDHARDPADGAAPHR